MGEFDDKVVCTKSKITAIADQIRTELEESDTYTLDEMTEKIHEVANVGAEVEPITIRENGTYTAPEGKAYSPVTVQVVNGTYVRDVQIVDEIPSEPTEQALYLIPNTEQIVPPLPLSIDSTVNRWAVTCVVPNTTPTFPYSLTIEEIKNSPKYFCFGAKVANTAEPQSFVSVPRTRSSYPQTMNFAESNTVTMPTYIYKYEPATDTDWVDITQNVSSTDWDNNVVEHNMLRCFYSTYSMIRHSLNHIAYESKWNAIGTDGKLLSKGGADEYHLYLIDNGVTRDLGIHDLKFVVNNFR